MSLPLSSRVKKVKPSATIAVTAKARELRAQGKDVIGLGVGEPDFDTPDHIKQAAIRAIESGFTKYTAVDGIDELKDVIIDKFARDNQLDYQRDQILVSVGAKHTIFNLCQAVLNPGDEVIIPAPCWVSYPDIALMADAEPVIVCAGPEQGYKITAQQLAAAITPKTRMLILNSPSNPTGAAYSRAELQALGEVFAGHPGIVIATDDMYEHIYWADEPFCSLVSACPDLYGQTITINGVSKCYAMTGWRIGYAGGPSDIIKAMKKIQGQSTSNPASVSQAASVAALNGDHQCVRDMVVQFKKRHDFVVSSLNAIKYIRCLESDGTFYSFPNIQDFIDARDDLETDVDAANLLLDKVGVALVPGSAFGADGYMRISFATSMENLEKAMTRIKQVFEE